MKKILTILFISIATFGYAQYLPIKQVSDNTIELHKAIFINKDSLALENLLSYEINYGHSGGKIENRKELISNVIHNKSVYNSIETDINEVIVNQNTAIVRCLLTGNEIKEDGKIVPLKLSILQTWTKIKKHWKLMARQAVKIN
jgi:Domain of unknown function (DUF4440)